MKTMKLMIAICTIGVTNETWQKGLTFEQIAQAINKDEVWVAALFYGQVSSLPMPSFLGAQYCIVQCTNNHGYPKGQSERG